MFYELSEKEMNELKEYVKNYKNEFRETVTIPGKLKFGCEVEFNTPKKIKYYQKRTDNRYNIKIDRSGDDVIEIISPILYNTKEDWQSLKDVLKNIKYGTIKSSVGGHIHYDASILEDKNIVNMLKFWHVFEDVIYEFGTGDFNTLRMGASRYAKRLKDVSRIINIYERTRLIDTFKEIDKYHGINLINHIIFSSWGVGFQDTYEVRVPNGSLNINTWQNNVEFFGRFLYFANDPKNKMLIEDMYNSGQLNYNFRNSLLLADLIYDDDESKIRFLNQFEQDNLFENHVKKKSINFLNR